MTQALQILANHCADARTVELEYRSLPAQQVVAGTPRVGSIELGQLGECSIGVWEMSPSISTDTEVDEFFIVLSGKAIVSFEDGGVPLQLQPGTIGHLAAGTRTTWDVTETLRKVYIAC